MERTCNKSGRRDRRHLKVLATAGRLHRGIFVRRRRDVGGRSRVILVDSLPLDSQEPAFAS
jgi:hypothetical protein